MKSIIFVWKFWVFLKSYAYQTTFYYRSSVRLTGQSSIWTIMCEKVAISFLTTNEVGLGQNKQSEVDRLCCDLAFMWNHDLSPKVWSPWVIVQRQFRWWSSLSYAFDHDGGNKHFPAVSLFFWWHDFSLLLGEIPS